MTTTTNTIATTPRCTWADGCQEANLHARGLCLQHYNQARTLGILENYARTRAPRSKEGRCRHGGCRRKVKARGLCHRHWREELAIPCTFPGCDDWAIAKELCSAHYYQEYRGVELHEASPRGDLLPQFHECRDAVEWISYRVEIDQQTGCWLWTGAKTDDGYGKLWAEGRNHYASRWSLEHVGGHDIPEGWHVDHSPGCSSTLCCNPGHLQAVSPEEHRRVTRVRREMLTEAGDDWEWTPPRLTRTLHELAALARMGSLGNVDIIHR